jgi:hypothetical protein
MNPDEHLLHEVFRFLAIPDRSVNEVQETGLVPLYQFLERSLLAAEKRSYNRRVVQRA